MPNTIPSPTFHSQTDSYLYHYVSNDLDSPLFPYTEEETALVTKFINVAKEILAYRTNNGITVDEESLQNNVDERPDLNEVMLDKFSREYTELANACQRYADSNYYVIYGDYRDKFDGDEILNSILAKNDPPTADDVQEVYCSLIEKYEQGIDYLTVKDKYEDFWSDCSELDNSDSGMDIDVDILNSFLQDNDIYIAFDSRDAIEVALNNTKAVVRVYPLLSNNERIYCPHFENSDEENLELANDLNRLFDMDVKTGNDDEEHVNSWPDANYSGSSLCFYGTVDLNSIFRSRQFPNALQISRSDDNYCFFNGGNGSGSCYQPPIRIKSDIVMRCDIIPDSKRYGVAETYGMSITDEVFVVYVDPTSWKSDEDFIDTIKVEE